MRPNGHRVTINPYMGRSAQHVEYMSDADLMAGVGGTMIFDTEIYKNYFLVAFKDYKTKRIITLEHSADEQLNARKLSWILHKYAVVGFNSTVFDIPLVWLAYHNPNPEVLHNAAMDMIYGGAKAKDLEREYKFSIYPTRHIDLIAVCPLTGSLKTYGARLHTSRLQDLPLDVREPITRDEADIVRQYCLNDLDTTELVFTELAEELALRQAISIEYKTDVMSKSNPQVAEAVISAEMTKITGKRPYPPKNIGASTHNYKVPTFISFKTPQLQNALQVIVSAQYDVLENGRLVVPSNVSALKIAIGQSVYRMGNGGLHSSEKSIGHVSDETTIIKDIDVSSFYPRIILILMLYPEHLGAEFLEVYETMYHRRLTAKKAKQAAISEVLKIALNGTFGKLGSPYSILYAPELLIQVTVTGQLSLLMLIEAIELAGIPVVSANTDGVVIKCPRVKQEQLSAIVAEWEQATGFELEQGEYASIWSRDVNNYLAFKMPDKDGKIEVKGKGAYLNPWGATGKEYEKLKIFRFHKNPMTTICIESAVARITRNVPIARTIEECRDIRKFIAVKNVTGGAHKDGEYVGKVARWYYAKGEHGTINKIKNAHMVPETEGAKPCMDLPTEFPDDVNYEWYVRRTIRILEELGFLNPVRMLF